MSVNSQVDSVMATIKLFASLREIAGESTITVPMGGGGVVRDLGPILRRINPALGAAVFDEAGELTGKAQVLVNGRNIEWLGGLDTPITDADTIALMAPVAGG